MSGQLVDLNEENIMRVAPPSPTGKSKDWFKTWAVLITKAAHKEAMDGVEDGDQNAIRHGVNTLVDTIYRHHKVDYNELVKLLPVEAAPVSQKWKSSTAPPQLKQVMREWKKVRQLHGKTSLIGNTMYIFPDSRENNKTRRKQKPRIITITCAVAQLRYMAIRLGLFPAPLSVHQEQKV